MKILKWLQMLKVSIFLKIQKKCQQSNLELKNYLFYSDFRFEIELFDVVVVFKATGKLHLKIIIKVTIFLYYQKLILIKRKK